MANQDIDLTAIDVLLNSGSAGPVDEGPFTVMVREGKNGGSYGNVVAKDSRIHYRFQSLHPMAVLFVLRHPAEAMEAAKVALEVSQGTSSRNGAVTAPKKTTRKRVKIVQK